LSKNIEIVEEETQALVLSEDAASETPAVDLAQIALIFEALLLAADGPLSLDQLNKLVGVEFNLQKRELRTALTLLGSRYEGSASQLVEVASGWRLQVRPEYAEWVARLWQEKPPKYSRALLETLALIIYRQPITRGEIEDVRGVAVSSNILRTLLERGWIRELGHKEVPGRPALFGSTAQFLDDFNLKSLDQLPALPDIKDLEQLEAALARIGGALPAPSDDSDDAPEPETAADAPEPAVDVDGVAIDVIDVTDAALPAPDAAEPESPAEPPPPTDTTSL
jgi:segregation and condensation protein B